MTIALKWLIAGVLQRRSRFQLACHSFVNENQLDEVDPEKLKQSFQTIRFEKCILSRSLIAFRYSLMISRGAKDASSGKEEVPSLPVSEIKCNELCDTAIQIEAFVTIFCIVSPA
jgi:hypothetical protein